MTIKALCFDADGVVVNPQMQFARYLKENHDISPEMTRDFFQGVFNYCLTGSLDIKQVLPSFLQNWGWKGSVEEFVNTWLFTDHVIDMRIINSIRRLRNDGMICCLTTSQENYRAEYMKNKMGFQDIFDHLFFSCEIGCQKPNHKFFHHVEKILNLKEARFYSGMILIKILMQLVIVTGMRSYIPILMNLIKSPKNIPDIQFTLNNPF